MSQRATRSNRPSAGFLNELRTLSQPTQSSRPRTSGGSQNERRTLSQQSQNNRRTVASTSRASQANENLSQSPEHETPTQRGRAKNMSVEEESTLVGSVIRYLLTADRAKTVILRPNIVKAALQNHSANFKYIMTKVESTLKEVFGYKLVKLDGDKYILTNYLENSGPHIKFPDSEKAEQVLLFIALTHIFMFDENGCDEDELFDFLRGLDIIEDNNFIHEYFGNVHDLLTNKFVKQGYFNVAIVETADAPVRHYRWGIRAQNEVEPRSILEFVSKIYGNCRLDTWPTQYKIMMEKEEGSEEGTSR